ncbi:MAG: hypothetical protein ACI9AR_000453 [Flavobacteriaceae bacterium]|jgi:hypothetical protein
MINLLPQNIKKYHNALYKQRIAVSILIAVILVGIVGIISTVPSYIITESKEAIAKDEIQRLKSTEAFAVDQQIKQSIRDINARLKLVNLYNEPFMPSVLLFDPVIALAPEGIALTNISFERSVEGEFDAILKGMSKDRQILQNFKDILDQSENFMNVILPVNAFADSDNIQFTITMKVVYKKDNNSDKASITQ